MNSDFKGTLFLSSEILIPAFQFRGGSTPGSWILSSPVPGPVQSRVLDPIHVSPRSSSGSGPRSRPSQSSGFCPVRDPWSCAVQGPIQSSIQDPIQSRVQELVQFRFRGSAAPPPFAQVIPCILYLIDWLFSPYKFFTTN